MSGVGYFIARSYFARMNRRHIAEFPQVAGFAFDLIMQSINLNGRYEPDELRFLARRVFPTLPPGGICVDIGANIGNHSLAFAPHFARVIALEPHPRTFQLLSLNAELAPNVTALNVGASNAAGTVRVAQNPLNHGATSISHASTQDALGVEFTLARLDEMPEIGVTAPVTFIKVDVEGHEAAALAGAEMTIRRNLPLIVLEALPEDISNGSSASVDLLRSFGYRHFYAFREAGWLGRLPRACKKVTRVLMTLAVGRMPSRAEELTEVTRLENQRYPMLLCSTKPLSLTGT